MNHHYWASTLSQRLRRRRFLGATCGGAIGAALLAACGGDSKKGASDANSLVSPIVDESKNVIRGGVWKNVWTQALLGAESGTAIEPCYSMLWHLKEGYLDRPSGEIEGDIVSSWETSPDRLTLTAKLTTDAHFTPQAPTNGRTVDAQDVLFTWDRIRAIGTARSDLANEFSPSAPIVSITAPDDRTVVIKLAEPTSNIYELLSDMRAGRMLIVPKEGQDTKVLDLSKSVRGSGAFYLDRDQQEQGFTFKRNPGFKQDKRNVPYVDEVDYAVLPEYATVLAQFKAGSFFSMYNVVRAEDILPLKHDLPELVVSKADIRTTRGRPFFGVAPTSPFRDQRVRQAYVMTWDRDLFLDVHMNAKNFRDAGLPVESFWETGLQSNTWKNWHIDPRNKDFGATSKYTRMDVAEAKKLMAAAGYTAILLTDVGSPTGVNGQSTFDQIVDLLTGMAETAGLFKAQRKQAAFGAAFNQAWGSKHGQFDGLAFTQSALSIGPVTDLRSAYHSKSSTSHGTDATFDDLLDKARREFDDKKRQEILYDAQRHEAEAAFFPRIGGVAGFDIAWPALRNWNLWLGGGATGGAAARIYTTAFIDPSKAPLKKA